MYRTCNQEYNPASLVENQKTPLYNEIGEDIPSHTKFLKLYKNQNVAQKWTKPPQEFMHNVFPTKAFPSHEDTYKYPA
jgi:hypothetical protein